MPEAAALSRRALFTLGIARVAGDPPPRADEHAPETRPAPAVDRDGWAARQHEARARCDGTGLWAPALAELLAAAGPGALVVARDDDLPALPFETASCDCAVSAFAPMFCLDARGAVGELFRVVRPGGSVAFTAWTGGGVVGRLLRLAVEHDPLPRGIPAPLTWGREERLRQDLECHSDRVAFEQRAIELSFASREEAVDRLCSALPPLAAVPAQGPLRAAARAIVDALAGDDGVPPSLRAPYVLARAIRGDR